jgi:hypothetical protein
LRHVLVVAATLAVNSRALEIVHLREALAQVLQAETGLRESGGTYLEDYQRPSAPPAQRGPEDQYESYQATAVTRPESAPETTATGLGTGNAGHLPGSAGSHSGAPVPGALDTQAPRGRRSGRGRARGRFSR